MKQQWYMNKLLIKGVLMKDAAVVEELFTVVADDNDDGVFVQFQLSKNAANTFNLGVCSVY